ncbi:chitobiosyldiphosphodolichol beta-1,4 mannosyltransferase Ecym_3466 [Eremothecium cymbalariae DBVPG|uniref:Chitobiosyldiphosphodolichol beta-mannosyltransferase n=1 Tax=Eremothecium cymbalariae (strain CBS 270.75 / DBVPG 7215 / KCTC 17166 / NRRL Y-17582) TaxID=931890 RepID=G8JS30_ERECY|nr:Hypothetical protein Ecym_3466 [Eremothecium cymbalariae DBVPG\
MLEIPNWLLILIGLYAATPFVLYLVVPYVFYYGKSTRKRIVIYVLGDIGHSPRMCYHARSFSASGWEVELCGYMEEQPSKDLLDDDRITIHVLPHRKNFSDRFVVNTVFKVIYQVFDITSMLWELRGCDIIMLQNPPSIPILPLAVVFKILTRTKLLIDWHNFGYSILQLKFGSFTHPLVLVSYCVEFLFSHFADYHLTVTSAMKKYLVSSFKLSEKRITVLHDRPAEHFKPLNDENREDLLKETFVANHIPQGFDISKGDTILVTSTSFTPDEDLNILLGALKIYENSKKKFDSNLPRILLFITGKGPLKGEYIKRVREYEWNHCHIEFLWLSAEDYPRLLRLCDYGVSLHTSSSGLDLPMKILDMFGSGLPVIAMDYPVLNELVQHNVNGMKFIDRRGLHESLIFAVKDKKLKTALLRTAIEESKNRWHPNWTRAFEELKIVHQ